MLSSTSSVRDEGGHYNCRPLAEIIDVSVDLHEGMLLYPGNPSLKVETASRIADGDRSNVSRIALGTHTGTHVDAPKHFLDDERSVDELALDVLIGACEVLDLTHLSAPISPQDLEVGLDGRRVERLLIKTRNSELWSRTGRGFPTEYVAFSGEAAIWLVEHGVRLTGIDFLSIEVFGSRDFPAHHHLLRAGVVVLEGLDLSRVVAGTYELVCLPLKLRGGDGAPARAVLIHR